MPYRVYAPIEDSYGCRNTQRVGHAYASVHKALVAAKKASEKWGVAEIRDESRSIYDRILAVFRNGREVQNRLTLT